MKQILFTFYLLATLINSQNTDSTNLCPTLAAGSYWENCYNCDLNANCLVCSNNSFFIYQYINETTKNVKKTCLPCGYGCSSCMAGSGCRSIYSGYYLLNSTFTGNDKLNYVSANACLDGCANCSSNTSCINCTIGYNLTNSGTCFSEQIEALLNNNFSININNSIQIIILLSLSFMFIFNF